MIFIEDAHDLIGGCGLSLSDTIIIGEVGSYDVLIKKKYVLLELVPKDSRII